MPRDRKRKRNSPSALSSALSTALLTPPADEYAKPFPDTKVARTSNSTPSSGRSTPASDASGSSTPAADSGASSTDSRTPDTSSDDGNSTPECACATAPCACPAPTLALGLHVLRAEALALAHVAGLYESSATAQTGLVRAVGAVAGAQRRGGKLVVCGIGKSGHVGVKLVATLKSLGVGSAFMHAAEAVHGDLGDVREGDVLLFITYSGKTPEMRALTPHLPPRVPVIAICGASAPGGCAFLADRPDAILLPAPIPVSEEAMFGVGAPTISTTVAMAVGDMLALTVAQRLHGERVKGVFGRNHPGGAIGAVGRG